MGIEDIDLGEHFDFEQMLNESFENAENNSFTGFAGIISFLVIW